jgi:hypothetical protein
MRALTFVILLVLVIRCNGRIKESNPDTNDKKITQKKEYAITPTIESNDSLRDPYSPYYLSDKSLKEIGQMILDDSVRPTDNDVTFRIMDSLLAKTSEDRKFYFKVYVKILDLADGALAEAVGVPGMKYVENFTKEFVDLSTRLTTKQLDSWANFIAWEILFDSQDDPAKGGQKFIEKLVENCSDLDSIAQRNLGKFNCRISQTIQEEKDNQ